MNCPPFLRMYILSRLSQTIQYYNINKQLNKVLYRIPLQSSTVKKTRHAHSLVWRCCSVSFNNSKVFSLNANKLLEE